MICKIAILPLLLLSASAALGQTYCSLGYTGASLNGGRAIAGGLSFSIGQNILEMPNSSVSLSTNLKLGFEDEIGSAIVVPALFILAAESGNSSATDSIGKADGGKIHLFTDLPVLLHYNWGLGSNRDSRKRFGFYAGGGMSYTTTGFTDTVGFSKGTAFYGWVVDGGIRFKGNIDLNFSDVISLRQPIGPIGRPQFYEVTLGFLF